MLRVCCFLLIFFVSQVQACTDFILMDQQNHPVVGRSMEFGTELEPQIITYPKGFKTTSRLEKNEKGLTWTNRYAYTAVTAFSDEIVVDGVNEAGLSMGLLWFPDYTQYPPVNPKEKSRTISLVDFGGWILGSFATIEEVKKGLKEVQLLPVKVPKIPYIPPLHLSLHDRSGKSIVVEYIDGKMEISDNLVGVLTNIPEFSWHMTNLSNYVNLSSLAESPLSLDQLNIHPLGMGSGLLGIPGDWTSPSRFVRMVTFKHIIKNAQNTKQNINAAFHLLNTVDIPFGASKSADGSYISYTQWVVVKDLMTGTLFYRSYLDLNTKEVKLEKSTRIKKIPLS